MNITLNKSWIMSEAHRIAKKMVGDYTIRISFGLRKAWELAKKIVKGENKLVELKGSEKQIKWATEIREKMLQVLNTIEIKDENEETVVQEVKNAIENIESASWLIDNRMCSVANISMQLEELKFNDLRDLRKKGIRKTDEEYIAQKQKYTEYKEKRQQAFFNLLNYKF